MHSKYQGDLILAYDKVDWHFGGDYPKDLPEENGGTHIGMFLAWAIHRGLEGELLRLEAAVEVEAVRNRQMTGRTFLFEVCDGKFWEDDLNAEGNDFAKTYYESHIYFNDYDQCVGKDLLSLYHVEDSWKNFDCISVVIDKRFAHWQAIHNRS